MNADLYIKWPDKILQAKAEGNLDEISEDRYQEYFGRLSNYSSSLLLSGQKIGVLEKVKETIWHRGLSEDTYDYLPSSVAEMPLKKGLEAFTCKVFTAVNEEVEKLDEGQTLPISTEIVESTFGSYKYQSAKGGQEITGNSLTIGVLVGNKPTLEEILPGFRGNSC